MKKSFAVLCLAILPILPAFSQPFDSSRPHGQRLIEHYDAVASLYPRLEGSAGEKRTLSYIEDVAAQHGLTVHLQDFSSIEDAHSFSKIARIDLPGSEQGRIFVIAPLNHGVEQDTGNDHSVSLAAALTVMEEAAQTSDRPNLSFVFLGAESDDRFLGTRLLLQSVTSEEAQAAAVYLDVSRSGGELSAELGADGHTAPRRLAESVVRALAASDVPQRQYPTSLQISRSRLAGGSVLSAYLEQSLPAVRIHDRHARSEGVEPVHASGEESTANQNEDGRISQEWAGAFAAFLLDSIARIDPLQSTGGDHHYVYGQTGETVTFLGERAYLILLLIVLSSPVVYGLIFRRRLQRYVRLITQNIWTLFGLLALVFFFFFVATAIVRGVLDLRNFPTLWQYAPGPYFLLKLLISVFLFAFMFHSLRGVPFPRRGSFYSASAIFLLFLDIVLLSVFDISFTFYFLWAFVAAFLFSLARWAWLKVVLLLVAPLWIVIGLVELFAADELEAAEALLLSPVAGNLIFAIVLLPFLLMLIRVDLMLHHRFSLPHGIALKATVLGTAAAVVLFAAGLVFLEPFDEERPQPVKAIEVIDEQTSRHTLELTSPASLEGLELRLGQERYSVDTDNRMHTIDLSGQPELVSLTEDSREFLSRRQVFLTVDSSLPPERVELSLESEGGFLIYDSNFPYVEGENALHFAVGRFPPNPLQLRFTVPGETRTTTRLRLHSQTTADTLESTTDAFRLYTGTRIVRESAEP